MLGRWFFFLQTWRIYPLAFLTFARATARAGISQPGTSLLPGKRGPGGRGGLSGRLGLANTVPEGFGRGCKMAPKGSGVPPKRGKVQRCLPGAPEAAVCTGPAQTRTEPGGEAGPPPALSPAGGFVPRWGEKPSKPSHPPAHKNLRKGKRSLTPLVAAFSSPH